MDDTLANRLLARAGDLVGPARMDSLRYVHFTPDLFGWIATYGGRFHDDDEGWIERGHIYPEDLSTNDPDVPAKAFRVLQACRAGTGLLGNGSRTAYGTDPRARSDRTS